MTRPTLTQCRLLILLALLGLTLTMQAREWYFDNNTRVLMNYSWDAPYVEIDFAFFDCEGNDSYFTVPATLYVDGQAICDLKDIHVKEEDGNNGAKSLAKKYGSWTPTTWSKQIGATTYHVRCYNPHSDDGNVYRATVVIIPDRIRPGESHTFKINGEWKANRSESLKAYRSWEATCAMPSTPLAWESTSNDKRCKRPTADKATIYPQMQDRGHDMTHATNGKRQGSADLSNLGYTDPRSMQSRATTARGVTSGEITLSLQNGVFYEGRNYKYIPIQCSYVVDPQKAEMGTIVVYDWYAATITGYSSASNLTATPNQWKKQVTLNWSAPANASLVSGTWTVLRKKGAASSQNQYEVKAQRINATTYTDTDADYDTQYTYMVAFIPEGTPTTMDYQSELLNATTTTSIVRRIPLNIVSVTPGEDYLTVKWTAPELEGNDNYTFLLYRAQGNGSETSYNWKEVARVNVSNKAQKEFTYTDKGLESCTAYYYKVELTALGNKTFSSGENNPIVQSVKGESEVTGVTASKGDYSGVVKVAWTARQLGTGNTQYKLFRRIIGNTTWSQIYETSGTASNYYYEDNTALPGNYYQYRVRSITKCGQGSGGQDDAQSYSEKSCDGFCRSTGTLSGRVSYDQGTAVQGVRVVLTPGDSTSTTGQFRSIRTSGGGTGIRLSLSNEEDRKSFQADVAVQLLLRPDFKKDLAQGTKEIIRIGKTYDDNSCPLSLTLHRSTVSSYSMSLKMGNQYSSYVIRTIEPDEFTAITLFYSSEEQQVTVTAIGPDGHRQESTCALTTPPDKFQDIDELAIGSLANGIFTGNIDEVRVFTGKSLNREELIASQDHPLSGSEANLFLYWPLDEGIENQATAYDYSRTNSAANGRHGEIILCNTSDIVPRASQFSLYAVTDSQGNYTLRGIPFSGEGTSYTITPQMGTHSFSPIYSSRFVSGSALVYSGVDFTDKSSFPVSGTIRYSGTTIPVEGCQIYVDGMAASSNGQVVRTDFDGKFTVSVPIGKHYIEARKEGHTLEHGGRYPEDPQGIGTTFLCDRELKEVTLWDSTLVNFSGHIVGGAIEAAKPIGFGLSKNNIGRAKLTLLYQGTGILNAKRTESEGTVSYDANPSVVHITSQTSMIASKAWRGASDQSNFAYIITDSLTGEFSAMLPPLKYELRGVELVSEAEENPYKGTKLLADRDINLSDPLLLQTDTLQPANNGNPPTYQYHPNGLKDGWYTPARFTVSQAGNEVGAFGIDSCMISDEGGSFKVPVYSCEEDSVRYHFGHPLFLTQEKYTFRLKAFEEYTNYDMTDEEGRHPRDIVPLSGNTVQISNALSADQVVYKEDNDMGGTPGHVHELKTSTIELDSLGEFTYTWMAGLPNITSPYTRAIQFYYSSGGATKEWRKGGMEAIALGELPTGNNFVTQGPDLIDMVLRDPPGTASSATWTRGSTTSRFKSDGKVWTSANDVSASVKLGLETTIHTGTVGFSIATKSEHKQDQDAGLTVTTEGEDATSWTRTVTTERSISTSDMPEYVGHYGDVFIGSSTNLIFGDARQVGLYRSAPGEQEAVLDRKDVTTTGLSFDTDFQLDANYIINVLLPNLEKVRDSYLTSVPRGAAATYQNTSDSTLYITELMPGEEGYGSDNDDVEVWGDKATRRQSSEGPSYRMVKPQSTHPGEKEVDQVMFLNSSIQNWLRHLAANEEQKVKAFEQRDRYIKQNLSFSSGSAVTMTQTTDTTRTSSHDITTTGVAHVNICTGMKVNGFGFSANVSTATGGGTHSVTESTTSETTSFSYTLAEEGSDALTVDVLDYGSWSPIFHTRGGQTSAPYEGEVRTAYYEPGKWVLMDATQQIEVPEITVDNLKWSKVSNIPTGGTANYTLRLRNNSETNDDVLYKLLVIEENNSQGAKLSIDGKVLGEDRIIKVPATETVVKSLQLQQTRESVLRYDSIGIVLASMSQFDNTSTWDQIADTVYVSAEFVPSSSDVHMALDKNVINTLTGDTLSITFDQFDRNYDGLTGFRIQAFKPGGTDWMTLQEYVTDPSQVTPSKALLPEEASVTYTYDMHGMSDGDYRFRTLSISNYGGTDITRSSNEISIAKDMVRPKPLGMPQPASGILGLGDDISLTFNEEIVKGAITRDDNFEITARLNGAQVEHNTALALQGVERAASTEAAFSLAGKSFSTDMWLLAQGAGIILSHGNGNEKFVLGLDDDMHLTVTVGQAAYTSEQTLPKGYWCYLTVSLAQEGTHARLNASVSQDASTAILFNETATSAYNGAGTLTIGEGLEGAIHELTLWDVAHDNAKAQRDRQKTKAPSTANLIGYWKMDEGEGRTITDYARNRHLTAAGDTWYINNVNKAVALDGTTHLGFPTGDLAATTEDNQAIEMWMKADRQGHEAQLLQMGDHSLWLDSDGLLKVTSKGETYDAGKATLTDNEWHHLAINILRSGSTAVYADGQRVFSTSSRNIGSLNSDSLLIGARREVDASRACPYSYDRHLTGMIDEVRVWNATLDASTLAANRKLRLTGKESGLVAYFPFEAKRLDTGGQIETVPCDTSMAVGDGMRRASCDQASLTFTDQAPAMQPKPTETNVSFAFTTSNDRIVIGINEAPATIEGCTLNFKVKRVSDVNGNICTPVYWSAYVHRNALSWSEERLTACQKAGEETTLLATLTNKGGSQQEWTLNGLPLWLRASATNGILDPLASTTLEFTVSKSCPIGKHEETLYLVNGDGIALPLALTATVTGDVPDWAVDASRYSSSMNLVGTLAVHGTPSSDTDDILAAFVDGECRGVAKPTYSRRYDEYFVMLDIACDGADRGKRLEFRIYDASTGTVWPVVQPSQEVELAVGSVCGSFAAPVCLDALDRIEQTLALGNGWNWTSLAVKADDMSLPYIMEDIASETCLVKSKTHSMMYYNNLWDGASITLNNREMYKVLMASAQQLTVTGAQPSLAEKAITVRPGWNWIAYNETSIADLGDAFAGLTPEDGDLVKGKQGFAIYDGYEWSGSLQALMPGQGYMYLSKAARARTFNYPTGSARTTRSRRIEPQHAEGIFQPTDDSRYPGNMTIVARVTYEGSPLKDVETGVFAGEECRTAGFTDEDGIVFLTIPGSASDELTFRIPHGGQVLQATVTIPYEDDGIRGNRSNPFEIAFDSSSIGTGMGSIAGTIHKECWYTTEGIRLLGKPTLPGVYFRLTTGTTRKSEKVVIK